MADQPDWGQVDTQLKQKAGANYNSSMLQDVQRNSSYGAGGGANNIDDWVNRVSNKAQLSGNNTPNSTYQPNGQGGTTTNQAGAVNTPSNPYPTIAGGGLPPNTNITGSMNGGWGIPSGSMGMGSDRNNGLWQTLMSRAQQSLNVNPNDPIIANQVNAYKANATRDNRNYVDQLAESGGPNANLGAEKRMAAESASQGAGNLQSTLMGNELTARRNEIQNALSQMGGQLSSDQQLGLQQQLGLINANLQQQGINSGNDQFAQTYGLNTTNQANYWDAIRSGLISG